MTWRGVAVRLVDFAPPAPSEVPRDGYDRPMIVPKSGGKPQAFARASSFIDSIEDKSALGDWQKRMVILGAAQKPTLLEGLTEVNAETPEGKKVLMQRAESAIAQAGAHEKSKLGTRYHELTELVDRGEPLPPLTIDVLEDMQAYMLAMSHLTPVHREVFTVCEELSVAGTPDGVCWYEGYGPPGTEWANKIVRWLLITDLKTGRIDYGGLKMPAQLAIYSRSDKYDPAFLPHPDRKGDPKRWDKWKKGLVYEEEIAPAYQSLGPVNQDWGLILNLIPGSGQCKLHWADLNLGWEAAKFAVQIRAMRSRRKEGLREWVPVGQTV